MREQARAARELDDRYGRAPASGHRSWWIAAGAIALAAIAVAWYVWAGPLSAPPATSSVQATVSGSAVTDDHHMGVTFTVDAPVDHEVACAVDAQSEDFTIVGWKIIILPPSQKQTRTFTHVIRTTSEGTAGFVDSCWLT